MSRDSRIPVAVLVYSRSLSERLPLKNVSSVVRSVVLPVHRNCDMLRRRNLESALSSRRAIVSGSAFTDSGGRLSRISSVPPLPPPLCWINTVVSPLGDWRPNGISMYSSVPSDIANTRSPSAAWLISEIPRPSSPSAPSEPSAPSRPSEPSTPSLPSRPRGPSGPSGPAAPVGPASPAGPSGPRVPTLTSSLIPCISLRNLSSSLNMGNSGLSSDTTRSPRRGEQSALSLRVA